LVLKPLKFVLEPLEFDLGKLKNVLQPSKFDLEKLQNVLERFEFVLEELENLLEELQFVLRNLKFELFTAVPAPALPRKRQCRPLTSEDPKVFSVSPYLALKRPTLSVPEGRQISCPMDDAQDVHRGLVDLIDEPVISDQQLANGGLTELGNHPPPERQLIE